MSSSSPFWGWERERVKALSFKKPWICLEKKNRPSTKLHNDSSLFNDALKTWNPKLPKLLCIQWLILDVLRLKGYTVCANNVCLTKKRKTIAGLPFLPQDILPSRKRVELPNWLQWQNNFSFIGFDDETCRNCSFSKPDGTGFFSAQVSHVSVSKRLIMVDPYQGELSPKGVVHSRPFQKGLGWELPSNLMQVLLPAWPSVEQFTMFGENKQNLHHPNNVKKTWKDEHRKQKTVYQY